MLGTLEKNWRKAAALVAAGLLAVGCTGGGQLAPEARLIQVADKMEQVETAHFTTEGQVSTQPLPAEGAAPGGGEAQQPLSTSSFSAEGDIQFPNRQEAKVTVTDEGASVTTSVVRIEDQVWVYDPQQRDWVEGTVNVTDQLQQLDPVRTVGLLRVASQDIKTVGQEQVNGMTTTHYQAVLDPTRARELIIRGNPDLAANLERVDGTIDMWVTEDNLLHQIRPDLSFTVTDPANGGAAQRTRLNTEFTVTLSDFNAPVDIQAPEAATGQPSQQPQPGQQMQPGQGQTKPDSGMNGDQ